MKNLKGLKRAGALCLACMVLILFSMSAYLQARESDLSDGIVAESSGSSTESETAQEEQKSMENTAVESEKQTEASGSGLGSESQTEISGESESSKSQTEIPEENETVSLLPDTEEETTDGVIDPAPGQEGESDTELEPGEEEESDTGLTLGEEEESAMGLAPVQEKESDAELMFGQEKESDAGLTLEEVLEDAQEQNIDFLGLAPGESLTFYASPEPENGIMTMAVTAVTVTKSTVPYQYSDYGYGNLHTYKYTVSFNDITATAYCIQPTNVAPGSSKSYKITKLKGAKALAKVCYYGTKAAGKEGFFADMHPDFSEGQRFVITHIAASYANGSPDAFTGATELAQSLAMELYEYCMMQPDIPETDMSLSATKVTAYVDKEDPRRQRTKEIRFEADQLQTITLKLPSGVVLHNLSTGDESAAGAKVTIEGGTKFYLSAPLNQAVDVGASWSSTMKGSVTKDYSAYKITTGASQQDLALVFGDGIEEEQSVSLSVKWLEPIHISIYKSDRETGKGLQGALFAVFTDKECSHVFMELPETDDTGTSSVDLIPTQEVLYLEEIAPPNGYVYNPQVYTINTSEKESTFTYKITNDSVRARIRLIKKDAQTGVPQGDAVLEHAVYGVYARADIVHPDGSSGVLFQAGQQVATLTTDAEGKASVDNLYPGKYYVKEISPSNGYLLDEKEYDLSFENPDGTEAVIEKECVSAETVIRQPFQLIKIAGNGKSDTDLLKGAGFSAWLASSLKKGKDGSYDFTSAAPVVLGKNGETEIFTDENGYAVSIPLPFGTYIVRETTVPAGFSPVADFEVRITQNSPDKPQAWRVLQDKEFEAKLRIVKKDDETQRNVLKENTEFRVYNMDTGEYVEQVTEYPKKVKHTSYFTDEEGSLTLPQGLPRGHYRIEEVTAPDGYTAGENTLEVTVDGNVAYRMDDSSGDFLVEAIAANHPVKGQLKIIKKGQVLQSYDKDFIYEERPLSGASYEVYAAENIYTADNQRDETGERILEYAEGAFVGLVTTGENGEGSLEDLPLGRYRIVEKTAPEGYVRSDEEQYVEFVYVDQDTPVVVERVEFVNELQKASVTAVKKNAENGAFLSGAEFGLYAKEDLIQDGETIVEADTLLATAVTGEDGEAVFDLELPFGTYYVRELQAPEGFLLTEETVDLTFSYEGQETATVPFEAVLENEPTTVKVTKSDITTGVQLEGASLSVLDKEGNVIDAWVSKRDEPHFISGLHIGETYRLREEFAPYGYLRAEEVEFTVSDSGEIQEVKMEDGVPVGRIVISKTGELVNSVTWGEMVAGTLEAVFGYVSGSLKEVVFEVHAAEDIKAADGVSADYYKKDDLVATITTDALGYAKTDDLPLGRYYVVEKKTAEGYVLDGERREIDLSYRDQDTPVVLYDEKWQNRRQTVTVTVLKKEKGTGQKLSGAVFALCAGEDIAGADGEILMEKDTVIEQKETGEDGRLSFLADLPFGGTYYVKEIKAPAGYVRTDKTKRFTFSDTGENTEQLVYDFTFTNRPTRVEVSKTDITTGAELPGAHLQVRDKNGDIVDSWTSGTSPHMIQGLEAGKTYTLREEIAPEGYLVAEEIEFKVKNTGKIQTVVMKDAREPEKKPDSAPKTGDDTKLTPWLVMLAVSACTAVCVGLARRRCLPRKKR